MSFLNDVYKQEQITPGDPLSSTEKPFDLQCIEDLTIHPKSRGVSEELTTGKPSQPPTVFNITQEARKENVTQWMSNTRNKIYFPQTLRRSFHTSRREE